MRKVFLFLITVISAASVYALNPTAGFQVQLTSANSSTATLLLVEATEYSDAYDYGADNELNLSITNPSQNTTIYAQTNIFTSGRADKLATNNLLWKYIGVMTNTTDVTYQFKFTAATYFGSRAKLYLLDHHDLVITEIKKDATYTFTLDAATATNTHITNRFQIVDEEFLYYHRDVASGNWATVCFPYKFVGESGVDKLYSLTAINSEGTKVAIDEVAIEDVVAGKPYIFQSDSAAQEFKYKPENKVLAPDTVGSHGLIGVFEDTVFTEQVYLVVNNAITLSAVGSDLPKYRCFIDLNRTPVDDDAFTQQVPGRRIFNVKNTPANVVNVSENVNRNGKIIRNGEFIIMREGRKYNAQGQEL